MNPPIHIKYSPSSFYLSFLFNMRRSNCLTQSYIFFAYSCIIWHISISFFLHDWHIESPYVWSSLLFELLSLLIFLLLLLQLLLLLLLLLLFPTTSYIFLEPCARDVEIFRLNHFQRVSFLGKSWIQEGKKTRPHTGFPKKYPNRSLTTCDGDKWW